MTSIKQSIDREKVAHYRMQVAGYPDSPADQREAAEYFIQEGLLREALAPLERLAVLQPDDQSIWLLRGAIFVELGQFADAEREFAEVVRRDPGSTAAYHNLGLIYCATDQSEKAVQQFQHIVQLEPDNPEALNDLAVLYALTGQPEKAQDVFDRCLTVALDYRKGWQNALEFAQNTGRLAWARNWIALIKAESPDEPELQEWESTFASLVSGAATTDTAASPIVGNSEEVRGTRVSVVIPAHNAACLAAETVKNLLQQTHRNLEIIVVDDGSTDDTEKALASFSEKITYVRRVHQGWSAAMNEGILRSTGQYIQPMSPGVAIPVKFIEDRVFALLNDPCADVFPFDRNSEDSKAGSWKASPLPLFRRRTFAKSGFFDEVADDDTGEWSRTLMAARLAYIGRSDGVAGPLIANDMAIDEYQRRIFQRWRTEIESPKPKDIVVEAPLVCTEKRTGQSLIIVGAEDVGGRFSSLAAAINEYTPHQCHVLTHKRAPNVPVDEVRELAAGADWLIFAAGIAPGAARRDRRLTDTDEVPFEGIDWVEYTSRRKCAAFLCSTPSVRGNYRWYDQRFRERGWPVLTSSADVCLNVPDSHFILPLLYPIGPEYSRPDFAVGPVVIVYQDRPEYASGREDMLIPVATQLKKKHGSAVSFGRYTELTRREALLFRHHAHIGLDRLSFGAARFGLTSLENSALGLVNIVHLDPFARSLLERVLGTDELPWHSPDSTGALLEIIDRLVCEPAELQKQMKQTSAWFRRWWSPRRIVQQFVTELENL